MEAEWAAQAERRQKQYELDRAAAKPLWYDDDEDELVFRSGRRVYVHNGMMGLSRDGTEIGYGADGTLQWPTSHMCNPDFNEPRELDLTADDMRELADLMITRWKQFKKTLG